MLRLPLGVNGGVVVELSVYHAPAVKFFAGYIRGCRLQDQRTNRGKSKNAIIKAGFAKIKVDCMLTGRAVMRMARSTQHRGVGPASPQRG